MSSEPIYYLTVALINAVIAFAGTRIKDNREKAKSFPFLIGSFLALSISWLLYSLEQNIAIQVASTILSSMFIWGITIFSFKRCHVPPQWVLISTLFLATIFAQTFFTLSGKINYVLHIESIFIPIAFGLCGHLFLKKKADRNPADMVIAYTYFALAILVVTRSLYLLVDPGKFDIIIATTQVVWPVFSVISGIFFLLSFMEEAQKRLTKESITDTLTGLFNRRMFDQQLQLLLPALSREPHFGALIYIDLDGFKPINDIYGHNAGDTVLIEFGKRLNQSSRGGEVIARIGGDEFALLVDNIGIDEESAYQSAKDIALRIQNLIKNPIDVDGYILQIGCSIGVHILTPVAHDAQSEVKMADAAMYQAKSAKYASIVFSDNLDKPKYNLVNIGIMEVDQEHQAIEELITSLLEHKTDLHDGFLLLTDLVDQHFQTEMKISKKFKLNFSKEHYVNHTHLLDSLRNTNLDEGEEVIIARLKAFIHEYELHNKEFDQYLNLKLS